MIFERQDDQALHHLLQHLYVASQIVQVVNVRSASIIRIRVYAQGNQRYVASGRVFVRPCIPSLSRHISSNIDRHTSLLID